MKNSNRTFLTMILIGSLIMLTGLYLVFAASELSFDQQVGIILTLLGAAIIAVAIGRK